LGRAKIGAEQSLPLMDSKALWAAFVHSKIRFFMHWVKEDIMELKSLMNWR